MLNYSSIFCVISHPFLEKSCFLFNPIVKEKIFVKSRHWFLHDLKEILKISFSQRCSINHGDNSFSTISDPLCNSWSVWRPFFIGFFQLNYWTIIIAFLLSAGTQFLISVTGMHLTSQYEKSVKMRSSEGACVPYPTLCWVSLLRDCRRRRRGHRSFRFTAELQQPLEANSISSRRALLLNGTE